MDDVTDKKDEITDKTDNVADEQDDVTDEKEKSSLRHKAGTIVGTILCIILIPILIINIMLIVKVYVLKEKISTIGGFVPLVVLTDSMNPTIQSGDLVIYHTAEAEDIHKGDIIVYFDPAGDGDAVVSHRVIERISEDGKLAFRTKGDANDVADERAVPGDKLLGVYRMRIAGAGNVVMFLQSPAGLIVCVVIPLLLLISYDMIRRGIYEKRRRRQTEAMLKELEELRAQNAEKEEREECVTHEKK